MFLFSLANTVFCRIKQLFEELHLEAVTDKSVPPTYKVLCLGVMVDALKLTLSVPEFRTAELTDELDRWEKLCVMSKRDVECLLGKLLYEAACGPPGRPFLVSLTTLPDEFFHTKFLEFIAKLMLPIPQLELLTILVAIKL